jgi:hypothetical protein
MVSDFKSEMEWSALNPSSVAAQVTLSYGIFRCLTVVIHQNRADGSNSCYIHVTWTFMLGMSPGSPISPLNPCLVLSRLWHK